MRGRKRVESVDEKSSDSKLVLETAIASISKQYSEVFVTDFDKLPDHQYISTGSIALDCALGGGLVRGRLMEIYGDEMGGKTSLSLMIIKNYLKDNPEGYVLFNDPEWALDKRMITSYGIDTNRIKFMYGSKGADNLNSFIYLIKTGAFGVAVIDSISALMPPEMDDKRVGESIVGRHAAMMQEATIRLIPVLALTNTLCIYINQTRSKVTLFGDPETTTGGKAIKFYYSYRLRISGGQNKASRILNKDGIVIGHKMTIDVRKNKLSVPYRTVELDLIYGKGFDTASELLTLGEDLGFISRAGTWYLYKNEQIGRGREAVLEVLRTNDNLYNSLKSDIMEVINNDKYGESEDEQAGLDDVEEVEDSIPT